MDNSNQPAFARAAFDLKVEGEGWIGAPAQEGLTKREYFAGKILQGMASSNFWAENFIDNEKDLENAVKVAIKCADVLLTALNTNPNG